jgi:L-threonylcarbamoyladenylate synthase
MTYLRIKYQEAKPAIVSLVAGSLKIGQVAVLPTDTIYGLSCLADNAAAIRHLRHLKKREADKPLIILVSSLAMLKKYAFVSARQAAYLKKVWAPAARPTTVIFKHRGRLPRELTGNSDGLAVRLPKSKFLIKILKSVKRPLVSTSFNLSGQTAISRPARLFHYFPDKKQRPDLVIDSGLCRRWRPSRLIDLRNDRQPVIIRK